MARSQRVRGADELERQTMAESNGEQHTVVVEPDVETEEDYKLSVNGRLVDRYPCFDDANEVAERLGAAIQSVTMADVAVTLYRET